MDLEALGEAIKDAGGTLKMILLCSPHNPGGRVWSSQELEALRSVTAAAGVRVVSDEIHGDLTFPGNRFVPWLRDAGGGSGSGDIALFAPSKTFNIPGLPTALAAVGDEETGNRLRGALHARMHKLSNLLTMEAALAAYARGEGWLEELRPLLKERYLQVVERSTELPGVGVFAQEGTFIAWLDFREAWGIPLDQHFPFAAGRGGDTGAASRSTRFGAHARKEGVWLSDGFQFGPEGEGFMRLNFATSREILHEGLNRLVRSAATFGA
jgi:cysteine-S-conjugate beta-lyase